MSNDRFIGFKREYELEGTVDGALMSRVLQTGISMDEGSKDLRFLLVVTQEGERETFSFPLRDLKHIRDFCERAIAKMPELFKDLGES